LVTISDTAAPNTSRALRGIVPLIGEDEKASVTFRQIKGKEREKN